MSRHWEILLMAAAAAAVLYCSIFIACIIRVDGTSMAPTITDGAAVLCVRSGYEIERGDIVVAADGIVPIIKRVMGLPGETVYIDENGSLYIDGELCKDDFGSAWKEGCAYCGVEVVLAGDEYFLLGDNREISLDSRTIGPVTQERIIGKVTKIWNR